MPQDLRPIALHAIYINESEGRTFQDTIKLAIIWISEKYPDISKADIEKSVYELARSGSLSFAEDSLHVIAHLSYFEDEIHSQLGKLCRNSAPSKKYDDDINSKYYFDCSRDQKRNFKRHELEESLRHIEIVRNALRSGETYTAILNTIFSLACFFGLDIRIGNRLRRSGGMRYEARPANNKDYQYWNGIFETLRKSDPDKKKYKTNQSIYREISKKLQEDGNRHPPMLNTIGRGIRTFKKRLETQKSLEARRHLPTSKD